MSEWLMNFAIGGFKGMAVAFLLVAIILIIDWMFS